jgi:ADP-ribosylation factor protein 6
LWRHYYAGTQALIFVVDSSDKDRIDEAKQELHRIIVDREMKDAILLVFANKNDLPNIMDTNDITEKLGLHKLKDRNWHVQSSCALTGDGLLDGLTWLNTYIQ